MWNYPTELLEYFEDNKTRKSAFNSLISESIDITIPKEMDKVCKSLDKLRLNIQDLIKQKNKYQESNKKLRKKINERKGE